MNLNDILKGLDIANITGNINIDITNIAYDSRKVEENTLFICMYVCTHTLTHTHTHTHTHTRH